MNTLINRVMNRTIMNISKRYSCCGGSCRNCLRNDPKVKLQIQKNREERQRKKIQKTIEIQSVPHHPVSDFMRGNLYFTQ